MEFILDQQAKFLAGMEEMRRRQDRFEQLASYADQQSQTNLALGKAMLA